MGERHKKHRPQFGLIAGAVTLRAPIPLPQS